MNWRNYAACRGTDPETFFPIGTSGPAITQRQNAEATCSGCPVRIACLAFAVSAGIDHGIWGGLDPDERRNLRTATKRRQTSSANP